MSCCYSNNQRDVVFMCKTPRMCVYVLAQFRRAVRLLGGVSSLEGRDGFELAVDPGHDRVRAHVNCEANTVVELRDEEEVSHGDRVTVGVLSCSLL